MILLTADCFAKTDKISSSQTAKSYVNMTEIHELLQNPESENAHQKFADLFRTSFEEYSQESMKGDPANIEEAQRQAISFFEQHFKEHKEHLELTTKIIKNGNYKYRAPSDNLSEDGSSVLYIAPNSDDTPFGKELEISWFAISSPDNLLIYNQHNSTFPVKEETCFGLCRGIQNEISDSFKESKKQTTTYINSLKKYLKGLNSSEKINNRNNSDASTPAPLLEEYKDLLKKLTQKAAQLRKDHKTYDEWVKKNKNNLLKPSEIADNFKINLHFGNLNQCVFQIIHETSHILDFFHGALNFAAQKSVKGKNNNEEAVSIYLETLAAENNNNLRSIQKKIRLTEIFNLLSDYSSEEACSDAHVTALANALKIQKKKIPVYEALDKLMYDEVPKLTILELEELIEYLAS